MRGPGEVARLAGIHVETLRYYERLGLLPPPARTRAGRRLYDDETVALLRSIRAARSFGLGIHDILSLLAEIRDDGDTRRALLSSLEGTLERTLAELARLEERRRKVEALLAEVRAAPPDESLKDRVRRAWRRIDAPGRASAKRSGAR
jgi:MerR family mercuric resistance operon transcriptional regulator